MLIIYITHAEAERTNKKVVCAGKGKAENLITGSNDHKPSHNQLTQCSPPNLNGVYECLLIVTLLLISN